MTIIQVIDTPMGIFGKDAHIVVNGKKIIDQRNKYKIIKWLVSKMDEGKVTTHKSYGVITHIVKEDKAK